MYKESEITELLCYTPKWKTLNKETTNVIIRRDFRLSW